jgi:hypothetical protein
MFVTIVFQNVLSSHLLPKNVKIRIYKTIIFPVVVYGCETWSLSLWHEHRLRVYMDVYIHCPIRLHGVVLN